MGPALVALWLAATIIAAPAAGQVQLEELTELQQKALDHALNRYHSAKEVINGFKVVSVKETTETEFSAGTFVRLEFNIKQTKCSKTNREAANCAVHRNGREMNCHICYKFASVDDMVASPFIDCLLERQLQKGRAAMRDAACKQVEQKDEDGLGLPGKFSFSKSLA